MSQSGKGGDNKEGKDGGRANWSRESLSILCDLCLEHSRVSKGKGGAEKTQRISWRTLETAFKKKTNLPYEKDQLRHKYDWMKTRWSRWKQLKGKEAGLGWDHGKGTISASDEWWEKKIKENSNFRTFKDEGVDPEIEYKMDLIFGGSVTIEGKKYTSLMHPPTPLETIQRQVEEVYSPSPLNYGSVPNPLFSNHDESGGSNDGCQNSQRQHLWEKPAPSSSPCPIQRGTQDEGGARKEGKRLSDKVSDIDIAQSSKSAKTDSTTTRKVESAALLEAMGALLQCIKDRNAALMTSRSPPDEEICGVKDALAMLIKMSGLTLGSPEFCFACTMIENAAKRTILLGLPDDKARVQYIKFLFAERRKNL